MCITMLEAKDTYSNLHLRLARYFDQVTEISGSV